MTSTRTLERSDTVLVLRHVRALQLHLQPEASTLVWLEGVAHPIVLRGDHRAAITAALEAAS